MKKLLVLSFFALLMAFSAAGAQGIETEGELPDMNIGTVADIFSWSDTAEDVVSFLNNYDGFEFSEADEEKYGKTYTAYGETEEERFWYVFYFDSKTEKLWEIEFLSIMTSEKLSPATGMQAIYDLYGMDDAEVYDNEQLNRYIADFDGGVVVAGPKTICAVAGSDPTDETYGMMAVVFLDREYFETK